MRNIMTRRFLGDAARCALTFLLAFSLTFYVQGTAFAEGEAADGNGTGTEQPAEPEQPARGIQGLTLLLQTPYEGSGWAVAANSWEDIPQAHGSITKKGESLTFDVQAVWSDGATSSPASGGYPVTWSVDDTSVAAVASNGVLTAKANGTVTVTAVCEGFAVSYRIDVSGQNNESYVTAIAICDEGGTPYPDDGAGVTLKGDLNQTVQFYARVTVYDPATGASTDYYTSAGSLSSQTGGAIADITWTVSDALFGYVEPQAGTFRPVEYGSVQVIATSIAGIGGTQVSGAVWVNMFDEDAQGGGSRPQSSLTVRVYYEDVPDQIVSEKTFTRAEVEAMGLEEHAYTAIGGTGFATIAGRGVPFYKILEAAGANLDGISYFSFKTADSGNGVFGQTVSYSMLFSDTRYYYPYFDSGKSTYGAEAVPPMLAVESSIKWNSPQADMSPDYDSMTDATCFRLLFGASNVNQVTTNRQIYWINTINVVLAGAPPTTNGDGTGTGTSDDGSGGGGAQGGTGEGAGSGDDEGDGTDTASGLGSAVTGGQSAEADADGAGDEGEARWSVYEVMNPNASNVDALDFDNPVSPYALPFAVGIAAAGGVQMGVRYRRQKLPLRGA